MTTDADTIAVYNARAAEYGRMTENLHELPALKAFANALPTGARVLDLGCGPGLYAARLAQAGFHVDALDASAEMVSLAAKQPGVVARQASFDDLEATGIYDGIWANFSLLHAPRSAFARHLGALQRACKPDAKLHIGMKLGTGEGYDSLGRFYTYYAENELEGHLASAGFTITNRTHGRGRGLAGTLSDWITILAHA